MKIDKNFNPASTCVTEGILIKANPNYISNDQLEYNSAISFEEENRIFTYNIEITNNSKQWVKLLYRHWTIIDSDGETQQVKGEGVVGKQPKLYPGESFAYSSFCPLNSDWGTMEGSFNMLRKDGSNLKVKIARFYLISDYLLKSESVVEINH